MGRDTPLSGPALRPPKKRSPLAVGCLVLLGIFALIWLIGALNDPSHTARSAGSERPKSVSDTAPPSQPRQVLVLDVMGEGNKTTKKFSVADEWDMSWSYNCAKTGSTGNFIIEVKNGDGGYSGNQSVNELGSGGSDVHHFHSGGERFLEVTSGCSWHVKAVSNP